MIITEITNTDSAKDFLEVARVLYKNDPNWVCPLDQDINAVFDPEKNSFHKHGKCIRSIQHKPG